MATEITGELGGNIVEAVQGNLPKAGGTMSGVTAGFESLETRLTALENT